MDSTTNMQHVSLSITVTALGFQTKKEIGNSKQQTHYDKLITIRWSEIHKRRRYRNWPNIIIVGTTEAGQEIRTNSEIF